ncbi:hypothetical protein C9374_001101 [Naegleria lovaniensis]|uniref:Rab family small GTPase n=1 Tax=Naegleria lovaniensis TaxID=51637 RepID=A0AA88GC37_NAELO|nr:uncharacterized protein C9374_013152 [Naegleria lovaniensis]XP_044551499.1 uncharacterized protein C9374_001101 [Naegleria lovaniensis]KAG2372788.1 hypothetical protein C9374_013152 [Naegleria lovaniensis]KAG2387507.1 hypothetical protein C9374_001101 [Naegleria lovaniensis]
MSSSKVIKVILLGDSAVGKSKLVERFLIDGYREQQQSTFALNIFTYKSKIDGEDCDIEFWDTAGQERFNNVHPSYYHQAHACILVFDDRQITYKNLEKWYNELQTYRKGIPAIVVCNKIDLNMDVTKTTFNFASKRELPLYYVSAADGTNVVKAFTDALKLAKKCRDNPEKEFVDDVLELLKD